MSFRKTVLGLASAGLLLGSTAAAAAPADMRIGEPVTEAEDLAGGNVGWIIGVLVLIGVIAVVVADTDEDDGAMSV